MNLNSVLIGLSLIGLVFSVLVCDNDGLLPPLTTTVAPTFVKQVNSPDFIDIKSEIVDGTNGVELTIIYRVSSRTIKDVQDIYKYIISNVSHINFELTYYENGLRRGFNCILMSYDIESSTKMITIPVQFPTPLKFYQIYRITTSYYLNNNQKFDNKDSVVYETCFGVPNKPRDLQSRTLSKDCDLELNWQAPIVVNAPNVCYYFLKVTSKSGKEIISKNVFDDKYVISGLTSGDDYNVVLEAINDVSCYRQTCNRQCYLNKLVSGYVSDTIRCKFDNGSHGNSFKFETLLFSIAFCIISINFTRGC